METGFSPKQMEQLKEIISTAITANNLVIAEMFESQTAYLDKQMDERFAIQDQRIDTKFASQDAKIDQLTVRVDSLGVQVQTMQTQLRTVNDELSVMHGTINQIAQTEREDIHMCQTDITQLKKKMVTLASQFQGLTGAALKG